MDSKRAIEVIENLRDYAYENWEDDTYGKELDEIGEAVELIKNQINANKCVGSAKINGVEYSIYGQ